MQNPLWHFFSFTRAEGWARIFNIVQKFVDEFTTFSSILPLIKIYSRNSNAQQMERLAPILDEGNYRYFEAIASLFHLIPELQTSTCIASVDRNQGIASAFFLEDLFLTATSNLTYCPWQGYARFYAVLVKAFIHKTGNCWTLPTTIRYENPITRQ